jgi:hypothetical protein
MRLKTRGIVVGVLAVVLCIAWGKILLDRHGQAQRQQREEQARIHLAMLLAPKPGPGKGAFDTFFTETSERSQRDAMTRLLALTPKQIEAAKGPAADAYDISKQIFHIYVPEAVAAEAPLGVIYYLGYKEANTYPSEWKQTLDEKRLIFISPKSNQRPDWQQAAIALDAIQNLKKEYTIDEKRIYLFDYPDVPGLIGLQMSFALPDIFSGFVHINRLQHFRPVAVPNSRNMYPPTLAPPPASAVAISKTRPHAFVLQDDFFVQPDGTDRRPLFEAAYKRDGFKKLLFINIKDREELHYPNFHGPWLQQVLEFLEPSPTTQPKPA